MKNFQPLIAVLTLSAIILAVVLILLPATSTARAENAIVGDYTLISAAPQAGGDDLVTVVDNHEGKLMTFQLTAVQNGRLELVGKFDLSK